MQKHTLHTYFTLKVFLILNLHICRYGQTPHQQSLKIFNIVAVVSSYDYVVNFAHSHSKMC